MCGFACRLGASSRSVEYPSLEASMAALRPIEKNKIRETGGTWEEQSNSKQGGQRMTFE